jgi:putative sigma-54 modulation protein
MNISITGHQIELTDALRNYVREKFSRIERHFDHVIDTHVILKVDKLEHFAEATIITSGKKLHAESSQSFMYAAIDDLTDKLDRQVKKHKEKLTERSRPTAQERGAALG